MPDFAKPNGQIAPNALRYHGLTGLRPIDYSGHVPETDPFETMLIAVRDMLAAGRAGARDLPESGRRAPVVNHAELVREIRGRAQARGLTSWPTPPSTILMEAGWVDLVVLGGRSLFIEVKSEDGRRTKAQIRMAGALTRAGLAYRLYRPSDLESGTVDADLEAIA